MPSCYNVLKICGLGQSKIKIKIIGSNVRYVEIESINHQLNFGKGIIIFKVIIFSGMGGTGEKVILLILKKTKRKRVVTLEF